MIRFLIHFVLATVAFYFVDAIIQMMTGEKMSSFIIAHSLLAFLMMFDKTNNGCSRCTKNALWLIITIFHGIAHIAHPPFINGTEVNPNYTPLYDFTIHAFQCLLVWYYHKDLFPVGVFGAILMITGSGMAHLNREFLATNFWLFVSGWGVFGAVYHMMLINHTNNKNIFYMNLLIWTLPYVGYLYPGYIPVWDNFVNKVGLFRLWFGGYYIAQFNYNCRQLLPIM
jgi:hypothetical protein